MKSSQKPVPKIPDGMVELMKNLAKNVLKEQPENIYLFAAEYFENLVRERDGSLDKNYTKFRSYEDIIRKRIESEGCSRCNRLATPTNEKKIDAIAVDEPIIPINDVIEDDVLDMSVNGVAIKAIPRDTKPIKHQKSKQRLETIRSISMDSAVEDDVKSTPKSIDKIIHLESPKEIEMQTNSENNLNERVENELMNSPKSAVEAFNIINEEHMLDVGKDDDENTDSLSQQKIDEDVLDTPTNDTISVSEANTDRTVIENLPETQNDDVIDLNKTNELIIDIPTNEQNAKVADIVYDNKIQLAESNEDKTKDSNTANLNLISKISPSLMHMETPLKLDRLHTPESEFDSGLSEKSFNLNIHENEDAVASEINEEKISNKNISITSNENKNEKNNIPNKIGDAIKLNTNSDNELKEKEVNSNEIGIQENENVISIENKPSSDIDIEKSKIDNISKTESEIDEMKLADSTRESQIKNNEKQSLSALLNEQDTLESIQKDTFSDHTKDSVDQVKNEIKSKIEEKSNTNNEIDDEKYIKNDTVDDSITKLTGEKSKVEENENAAMKIETEANYDESNNTLNDEQKTKATDETDNPDPIDKNTNDTKSNDPTSFAHILEENKIENIEEPNKNVNLEQNNEIKEKETTDESEGNPTENDLSKQKDDKNQTDNESNKQSEAANVTSELKDDNNTVSETSFPKMENKPIENSSETEKSVEHELKSNTLDDEITANSPVVTTTEITVHETELKSEDSQPIDSMQVSSDKIVESENKKEAIHDVIVEENKNNHEPNRDIDVMKSKSNENDFPVDNEKLNEEYKMIDNTKQPDIIITDHVQSIDKNNSSNESNTMNVENEIEAKIAVETNNEILSSSEPNDKSNMQKSDEKSIMLIDQNEETEQSKIMETDEINNKVELPVDKEIVELNSKNESPPTEVEENSKENESSDKLENNKNSNETSTDEVLQKDKIQNEIKIEEKMSVEELDSSESTESRNQLEEKLKNGKIEVETFDKDMISWENVNEKIVDKVEEQDANQIEVKISNVTDPDKSIEIDEKEVKIESVEMLDRTKNVENELNQNKVEKHEITIDSTNNITGRKTEKQDDIPENEINTISEDNNNLIQHEKIPDVKVNAEKPINDGNNNIESMIDSIAKGNHENKFRDENFDPKKEEIIETNELNKLEESKQEQLNSNIMPNEENKIEATKSDDNNQESKKSSDNAIVENTIEESLDDKIIETPLNDNNASNKNIDNVSNATDIQLSNEEPAMLLNAQSDKYHTNDDVIEKSTAIEAKINTIDETELKNNNDEENIALAINETETKIAKETVEQPGEELKTDVNNEQQQISHKTTTQYEENIDVDSPQKQTQLQPDSLDIAVDSLEASLDPSVDSLIDKSIDSLEEKPKSAKSVESTLDIANASEDERVIGDEKANEDGKDQSKSSNSGKL